MHSFACVIAPFFLFLYPVYLNFYVTNLSGQQQDLQLYVESELHRGLKFYHQKYNPLTPWWNERGSNPCLSGRERALNPLSHQAANIVVEDENKRKKRAKRAAVSDAVPNEDVNVKYIREKSSDVKKQNFEHTPPKRVVGMYKYMVNCAVEPHASQFDPSRDVFPCADVEYGLDDFYDLESIGIKTPRREVIRKRIPIKLEFQKEKS